MDSFLYIKVKNLNYFNNVSSIVPDNVLNAPALNLMNNESPSKQITNKTRQSNNPSHILQRKQVQKLNKNKLTEQDKENFN